MLKGAEFAVFEGESEPVFKVFVSSDDSYFLGPAFDLLCRYDLKLDVDVVKLGNNWVRSVAKENNG